MFLPLLRFSPFYTLTHWVLLFTWLFGFLPFCFGLSNIGHFFFVASHYCLKTVSFIFRAFYVPYKTIQTLLLMRTVLCLQESLALFWAHLVCFFFISSTRFTYLYFERQSSVVLRVQLSIPPGLGS